MYSGFLRSRHDLCKELVKRLSPDYKFVSVLGKHITGQYVSVTTATTAVVDTPEQQCGFVVKLFDGKVYSEYSFTDITKGTLNKLEKAIREETKLSDALTKDHVKMKAMPDEPMKRDFARPISGKRYSQRSPSSNISLISLPTHRSLSSSISDDDIICFFGFGFVIASRICRT